VRRFLFICGCARSGTSALTTLVDAHADISVGMERYLSRFLTGKGLTPDLFEEERFFSVEPGDTFYDDLEFAKPLYKSLRSKWQRSLVFGDKIPRLYTRYDHVFENFPDARIIFLSRNLIDVANSYKRRAEDASDQEWSENRGAGVAIDDWNNANSLTLAAIERYPGKIYVLSYESLFVEHRGLDELFGFVGLKPGSDVRAHFQKQLAMSKKIIARRSESLSEAEKLAVCLRADTDSFRQLIEKAAVLPSAVQSESRQAGGSKTKPANTRAVRERPLLNSGQVASTGLKEGKYQESDRAIVDYQYANLPGTDTSVRSVVRGPIPADLSADFIACVGGAHTLGRFVQSPYPALLQKQLGIPVLNLGHGGGKPEFYLQSKGFIEVINKAQCAVIQVMSARGSPNRFLTPTSHTHNMMKIAEGISSDKNPLFVDNAYRKLLQQRDPETIREAINETRAHWLSEMENLLDQISIPKVLFWFSVRTPAYVEGFDSPNALLGDYPHLVTDVMIDTLKAKVDGYVECVSKKGLPNALRDRNSGAPVEVLAWQSDPSYNHYYPSPEMHVLAADALAPALRKMMHAVAVS
jgi:hypothetical protein